MAPLAVRTEQVRSEWIDYNGHLSEAYYVLLFGFGTDDVMDAVGLDAEYRAASQASLFTVEAHVRYLDQVGADDEVEVRSWVVGVGEKRLRLWHELSTGGTLCATEEVLAVHVDTEAGRATPLPESVLERARRAVSDLPEGAGRAIGAVR